MTTSPPDHPAALVRAEQLVREFGFGSARVEVIDPDGGTVLITAAPAEREPLFGPAGAELSRRLKQLGFRYVALDLGPTA